MKIRVLGGGWYGCHLASILVADGHEVELHEIAEHLFAGASGGNPARLHLGFHYPRSNLTRAACQDHQAEFMAVYGHLTRHVPINIYAIAARDSIVDFGTYCQILKGELEFIRVDPKDYGFCNVEGAVLTGERHVIVDEARKFFDRKLSGVVSFSRAPGEISDDRWDLTIDATFCANDEENIDRYEPCVVGLLEGPTNKAVTIMDGGFPGVYPWNEEKRLSSVSSALFTPISKECRTYREARAMLDRLSSAAARDRVRAMYDQMACFWPGISDSYYLVGEMLSIRAMPRSGADARLVDVVKVGDRALRIRAGKIDAIFAAERIVKEAIA